MNIITNVVGMDAAKAYLRGLEEKKVNVAIVAALNDAAYVSYKATQKEISRVFDRPTSWVIGGVRYIKARKDKLSASVDFDQWGNKTNVTVGQVLRAQIYSGQRKQKRHEIALQRAGILPQGMFIVPGDAAKIDQYGNMSSAQIVEIISWFRAFGEQGFKANATDKTRASKAKDKKKTGAKGYSFFTLKTKRGKLLPGVYKRFITGFGSSVRPVMIFVRQPTYRKRLDFYTIAETEARKEFSRAFPMYLNKLLAERGL